MKKAKCFAMLLFAAMVSASTVSCGSDNDSSNGGGDQGGSKIDTVTTPAAQKIKLENVANELASKINADDFRNFQDITKGVDDTETSAITDWFDGCMEACEGKSEGDSIFYELYALSNFVGSFELKGNKWEESNETGDYLQFKFKDNAGNDCVAKLTRSGKEAMIHHESFDEKYSQYTWTGYGYKYFRYKNIKSYSIPENISVTLTQGGKTVATTDIHTTLSLGLGDVDITRDAVEVTMTRTINDYKFVLQKALYSKSTSASVPSYVVTKGGEELISLSAMATGDISDSKNPEAKTANFEVKVLGGKARVVGKLTDGQTLQRNLKDANKNDANETEYKRYITNANALIDVKLYLDNSNNYGAYLRLQPFEEDYHWSSPRRYWKCKPVLVFGDGTSYTFDEYFDEASFDTAINKVQNIIADFTRMFGN